MGVEEFLVRTRFSSFLIEDLKKELLNEKGVIDLLSSEMLDKKSIAIVSIKIKELKDKISIANFLMLKEELSEIKEDLKWIKSKQSQYIIEVNDWYNSFKDEFKSIREYEDVFIGSHTKIMCVFVTGKIDKTLVHELTNYLLKKKPPYKLRLELF